MLDFQVWSAALRDVYRDIDRPELKATTDTMAPERRVQCFWAVVQASGNRLRTDGRIGLMDEESREWVARVAEILQICCPPMVVDPELDQNESMLRKWSFVPHVPPEEIFVVKDPDELSTYECLLGVNGATPRVICEQFSYRWSQRDRTFQLEINNVIHDIDATLCELRFPVIPNDTVCQHVFDAEFQVIEVYSRERAVWTFEHN